MFIFIKFCNLLFYYFIISIMILFFIVQKNNKNKIKRSMEAKNEEGGESKSLLDFCDGNSSSYSFLLSLTPSHLSLLFFSFLIIYFNHFLLTFYLFNLFD